MREVFIEVEEGSPLADGAWLVQPMALGEGVHVVFEPEATLHELDCGCWCRPTVELREPSTERPHAEPIYIHRHGIAEVC